MKEYHIDIDVKAKKWVEAELKGNYKCPICNSTLILIVNTLITYAFCPKCKKYFVQNDAIEFMRRWEDDKDT